MQKCYTEQIEHTGTVLTPGVHGLNLLHNVSDAASAPDIQHRRTV